MNLKSKILVAGLAAIIAGGGIFTANINTAQAQTDGALTDPTIAQLQQMVETLKQQIQQIIALIAQLKPLETCGNGFCRFGETAATCVADCGQPITNCAKEGEIYSPQAGRCCGNLISYLFNGREEERDGVCVQTQKLWDNGYSFYKCINCGDGKCNSTIGENACNCAADCGKSTSDNGKAKCLATGGAWKYSECIPGCGTPLTKEERLINRSNHLACASVCNKGNICECSSGKYWASREEGCINKPAPVCGNSTCETGETATNCSTDCGNSTSCAKEGEKINSSGFKKCCPELIADPGCENCSADSWTCRKPANCGNGTCETGETAINCPKDCQNGTTCKTLWWSDDTSKICQQKQFCGAYMYLGLKTYNTQSACQAALDAACSKECVAKGYALGGNYCVANEEGVLEACCCAGSASKCGNGVCESETGETATNCSTDCGKKACYGEGEGEIGMTAGPAKTCCSGLTAQPITTTYTNGTQAVTEGFICRKPVVASCKKEGELFGYLEGECCNGLLKVYPDGAKTYSTGESQNFQVTCKKPVSYITNAPDKCVAVNIKALTNGKYVTAENGGANPLIANRDIAGPWELFYILPAADGSINIKAGFNGKYVTAENGGANPLIANRDAAGPWEKFVISPIFNTNYVVIKASINNRYVTAENNGAQTLIANRDEIGPWEKFIITKVSDCRTQ